MSTARTRDGLGILDRRGSRSRTDPWCVLRGPETAPLVGTDSLAALVRLGDEQPFELGALPLGPSGHRLAQRLIEHIHGWHTRGRPGTAGLHVSAYPRDTEPGAITDPGNVIDKRYNRLVFTWAS